MPDPKALKILNDTYWSTAGWQSDRSTSTEDFAYAKWAGVMFEAETISHDDGVERAIEAVSSIDKLAIAKAFVASLESRRLDLRSALGSFAIGQFLPEHSFSESGRPCPVCNAFDFGEPTDLNVLNFERHKWGGVRHYDPIYIALDLNLFAREPIEEPNTESVETLRCLISLAKTIGPEARARDLEKSIVGKMKSNKAERETLLQILGYCGILEAEGKPGFFRQYIKGLEREVPPHGKIDWTYPFAWWRGSDGVRCDALDYWFGELL